MMDQDISGSKLMNVSLETRNFSMRKEYMISGACVFLGSLVLIMSWFYPHSSRVTQSLLTLFGVLCTTPLTVLLFALYKTLLRPAYTEAPEDEDL